MTDLTNIGSKKGQDIVLIIAILSVVIIIFLIIYKYVKGAEGLLEKVGLKDTEAETATEDRLVKNIDKAENADYWKPTLWKQKKGATILTMESAKNICKQIYESVGYFKDTPAQAVAAFKQCKNKAQISFLVDRFNAIYNIDLKTFLNERFDTIEQKKALNDIYNYTENLPRGY